MRSLGWRLAAVIVWAVQAGTAHAPAAAAAAAPAAAPIRAAADALALAQPAQFIYLGRPYCWYPYGWAGAGWYWCGYGTRSGLGWGGAFGWNGWAIPRSYGATRIAPRRYR